jgi:hypothetical protein
MKDAESRGPRDETVASFAVTLNNRLAWDAIASPKKPVQFCVTLYQPAMHKIAAMTPAI